MPVASVSSNSSVATPPRIGGRVGIEDSPPGGRSGGGMAPPSKKLESKDDTDPPIGWSPNGPPPKASPKGPGQGGSGPDAAGRPARRWPLDLPGWVWFWAFLLVVVVLSSLRK